MGKVLIIKGADFSKTALDSTNYKTQIRILQDNAYIKNATMGNGIDVWLANYSGSGSFRVCEFDILFSGTYSVTNLTIRNGQGIATAILVDKDGTNLKQFGQKLGDADKSITVNYSFNTSDYPTATKFVFVNNKNEDDYPTITVTQ